MEKIHFPKNYVGRSSMQVSFMTRLLGMTVTLFVLILTVKSELLQFKIITWQLAIAIPILFAALITNSKISSPSSFEEHRKFNLFVNSVSVALVINIIGLLLTRYVDKFMGFSYFILLLLTYFYFFMKDLRFGKEKIWNELIILALLILFGLVPAWTVLF
ncbi:hypothetical protein KA107_02460 [Candidatus Pacearchaeota archaeon]|nr:hypothetical protein [Candidatus Pacearchaeota archaeon]